MSFGHVSHCSPYSPPHSTQFPPPPPHPQRFSTHSLVPPFTGKGDDSMTFCSRSFGHVSHCSTQPFVYPFPCPTLRGDAEHANARGAGDVCSGALPLRALGGAPGVGRAVRAWDQFPKPGVSEGVCFFFWAGGDPKVRYNGMTYH